VPAEGEDYSSMRERQAPQPSPPLNGHDANEARSSHNSGGFGHWLRSILGLAEPEGSFKEALQDVLEEHAEDLVNLPAEERQIFSNLIEFGDVEVSEIMTPQPDMVAVELGDSLQELKAVLLRERHTRMPVYQETIDQVKGFIHVKDLIPFLGTSGKDFQLADMLRKILFVPPAMKIVDLLLKMRSEGVHIAIVVDEYGGTSGLVTLEDLFEKIVGQIQDEHDADEPSEQPLRWDGHGQIELDAKTRVSDLEKELSLTLYESEEQEDDFDTIGGLIFATMGRVPVAGDAVKHTGGMLMEVLEADDRRIKRVRLTRPAAVLGEPTELASSLEA
jgi:CBS domain containing-hemolysin-like protein